MVNELLLTIKNDLVITTIYILFSALFSASEVSLFSIPREKMRSLKSGNPKETRVFSLLNHGEDTLIALLLGNLFVNLMIVGSIQTIITAIWGESPLIFFIVSTTTLLIFGEILPKAIALKLGDKVILLTAPLLLLLRKLLIPLIFFFRKINRSLLRWNYRFVLSSPQPFITAEEYHSAIERASDNGDLSSTTSSFLREMGELVSFPLSRIVTHRSFLTDDSSSFKITYNESETVTAVHIANSDTIITEFTWFSLSRDIGDLMLHFRESDDTFVLVHDEYGEFYGIASSDTLFQYLNNLYKSDEKTNESIEIQGDEPIARYINWFDDEMLDRYPEIQSVGGILVAWFEMIPTEGDTFESQSYIFEVLLAAQNSVSKLRITRK